MMHSFDSQPEVKAFLLAAGEGSRLRPLTLTKPKPMLPVYDRPLLEHLVLWLRSWRITQMAIALHYKPEVVTSHFGDGSAYGVQITYSPEKILSGTAGALRNLDGYFSDTTLVVYGDLLTNVDLGRLLTFHRDRSVQSQRGAITMSLYTPPNPCECGIVELDGNGRVLRMKEKPKPHELFSTLSFSGIMVLDRPVIDLIPSNTFCDFGFDIFPACLRDGVPVYGLPIAASEFVIDIGTPERYAQILASEPLRLAVSN